MDPLSNHREEITQTRGTVINWGWFYDIVIWFFSRGNEDALRQMIADLIRYQPGEKVLDVGCGTGSLALVAKERVDDSGSVQGIHPGPRQIARARSKAVRRGLSVDFRLGVIERLPFPDQTFDLVQSTFMIDHVPSDLQRQGFREIARVLKPRGRLFVLITSSLDDLIPLMKEAGFSQVEKGETTFLGRPGLTRLYFARGQVVKEGI
jgi:ubiquinone/menaquinone biosynthesis C-methylase UbiE